MRSRSLDVGVKDCDDVALNQSTWHVDVEGCDGSTWVSYHDGEGERERLCW